MFCFLYLFLLFIFLFISNTAAKKPERPKRKGAAQTNDEQMQGPPDGEYSQTHLMFVFPVDEQEVPQRTNGRYNLRPSV
jgi:hypothetical protein